MYYGNIGRRKEKGKKSIFKAKMAENFPNLGREMDLQIHETQGNPSKGNLTRFILRHIILNLPKKNNFKNNKRKEVT